MRRTLSAVAPLFLGLLVSCTPEPPQLLAVDQLADTRDVAGPYVVTIVARGVDNDDTVNVLYSVNLPGSPEQTPWTSVEATQGSRDDVYLGRIPGQPPGSTVQYFADVARGGQPAVELPIEPFIFQVLAPSGACRADSDCLLGSEICADGTCRAYSGTCVDTSGSLACPGGYVCDVTRDPHLCVIAPIPCAADAQCPTVQECDAGRDECVARQPCLSDTDCPAEHTCSTSLGLCFRD